MRYFQNNDDNSSCNSSSEELEFKEFIGLAVDSEASSEEDCTPTAKPPLEDVPVRSGDDLPAGDLPNVSDIYSKTELDVSNAEQFTFGGLKAVRIKESE